MAMQAIGFVELNATQKTITFSNIPQDGTDLLLTYSTRSDRSNTDDPVIYTLNGTSANYASRALVGTGSSVYTDSSSLGTTSGFAGYAVGGTTTANTFGNGSIYIVNYRVAEAKSINIDFVGENNATTIYMNIVGGVWSNTAAITTVSISSAVGNFVAGTTATLYKITKGSDGVTTIS